MGSEMEKVLTCVRTYKKNWTLFLQDVKEQLMNSAGLAEQLPQSRSAQVLSPLRRWKIIISPFFSFLVLVLSIHSQVNLAFDVRQCQRS